MTPELCSALLVVLVWISHTNAESDFGNSSGENASKVLYKANHSIAQLFNATESRLHVLNTFTEGELSEMIGAQTKWADRILSKDWEYNIDDARKFERVVIANLVRTRSDVYNVSATDVICRSNDDDTNLRKIWGDTFASFCIVHSPGVCKVTLQKFRGEPSFGWGCVDVDHTAQMNCRGNPALSVHCCRSALCNYLTDGLKVPTVSNHIGDSKLAEHLYSDVIKGVETSQSRSMFIAWGAAILFLCVLVILLIARFSTSTKYKLLQLRHFYKFVSGAEEKKGMEMEMKTTRTSPQVDRNGVNRTDNNAMNIDETETTSLPNSTPRPGESFTPMMSEDDHSTLLTTSKDPDELSEMEAAAQCAKTDIESFFYQQKALQLDDSTGSGGRGGGAPVLQHRTLARQMRLGDKIGSGRFGEVHLSVWRGEQVAVKVFHAAELCSFGSREVQTFSSLMLRHPNIVRFIAADNHDCDFEMALWMVMEYCPNGSLADYLFQNEIDERTYLIMMRGIANGLAFLHCEIQGTIDIDKPGIGHGDIKAKNILVKDDLTCCIADLGLSVCYDKGTLNIPISQRMGTLRYLPPEYFTDFTVNRFESYRNGDIYSFALVMWEAARRTKTRTLNAFPTYMSIAYYDDIARDPSPEEMKDLFEREVRPELRSWANHRFFNELGRLMEECWSSQASARLGALGVRIKLERLARTHGIQIPDGLLMDLK